MKFTNYGVAPTNERSGGGDSIPSWRRKWIEEKVQKVQLECGCIVDISIPVLTFINTFDGTEIDCVIHHRFAKVVKKYKPPKSVLPGEPMF